MSLSTKNEGENHKNRKLTLACWRKSQTNIFSIAILEVLWEIGIN